MVVRREFHAIAIFIPKYSPKSPLENKRLSPTTGLYEIVKGIFLPLFYLQFCCPQFIPLRTVQYST